MKKIMMLLTVAFLATGAAYACDGKKCDKAGCKKEVKGKSCEKKDSKDKTAKSCCSKADAKKA
jgi:hypothetical protein